MGFFDSIVGLASATVKVALTPVALVADVTTKVITGENPELTSGALESAMDDFEDATGMNG